MPVPERLARGTELIRQRQGITLRPLDMKDFQAEVERIKELYNAAWEKNWGFVPMTDHEIDHLAKQFKPVVIPDLVPFAEKDGKSSGSAWCCPTSTRRWWATRAAGCCASWRRPSGSSRRSGSAAAASSCSGILPE